MADLAGSERVSKSKVTGKGLDEARHINQSLSALGVCINALTERNRSHVPYRDSKLTYLLKDSLGGNTKTTLLVTCSPHWSNFEETMSTLKFAKRAKRIQCKARINAQVNTDVVQLRELVNQLRQEVSMKDRIIQDLRSQMELERETTAVMQASASDPVQRRLQTLELKKRGASLSFRRRRSLPASFKFNNGSLDYTDYFLADTYEVADDDYKGDEEIPVEALLAEARSQDEQLQNDFESTKNEVESLLSSILGSS
jgi:Kinesin motor domain